MNRTIKNDGIKLTIFFVTSLFAMTLLIQSTAYGQVPPIVRTPRTIPVAAPTPTTTTIAKPTPVIIVKPVNPNRPATSLDLTKFKPDLRIAEVKYDKTFFPFFENDKNRIPEYFSCKFYVRVVNDSPVAAKKFSVWLAFESKEYGGVKYIDKLAGNQEVWIDLYSGKCSVEGSKPAVVDLQKSVRVIVDAEYVSYGGFSSGFIYTGQNLKANEIVNRAEIDESDEDNNELIVKIADMKPYTP